MKGFGLKKFFGGIYNALIKLFNEKGVCFTFIALFVVLFNIQAYEYGTQLDVLGLLQNILLVTVFTTLVALVCVMPIYLIFGGRTPGALVVLSFVTSMIFFADSCYTQYSVSPISISQLTTATALMDSSMFESISNVINSHALKILLYFIIYLIIYVIYKREVKKSRDMFIGDTKPKVKSLKFLYRFMLTAVIVALGVLGLNFTATKASALNVFWTKTMLINQVGLPYYHIWDVSTFAQYTFQDQTLTENEIKELKAFKEEREAQKKSKYFGVDKGKNVIIVQVEALQEFVVGAEFDGKQLTPVLNALKKNEIYFDNFYPQTGLGNTADCEYISVNSMLPSTFGVVNEAYQHNEFFSLAHQLREAGYTANSYHAYEESFWNRNVMHPKYGFEKFYSKKDFSQDEVIGWSDSDSSFYKQVLDNRETLGKKPKFSYLTSLTCHFPFTYYKNPDLDTSKYKGTLMGDYLHGVTYSDYALGELIKDLKKRGEYENTLIVIYGDHKAINSDELNYIHDLVGTKSNKDTADFEYQDLEKVPFLIVNSNAPDGVISNVAGQVDVAPTICNLLGIETQWGLGRNVFDVDKSNAGIIKSSGTIVTNKYVISSEKEAYDKQDKKVVSDKAFDNDTKKTIEFLRAQKRVSDIILSKDAVSVYKKIGEETNGKK